MRPLRTLRYAVRGLRQTPTVTLISILTLALGVGAAVAIFSLVDAVLLRPLPFPHSDRLVSVRESDRQFPSMSVSFADYLDWVKDNHSFSALSVYRGSGGALTHAGAPAVIHGQVASANYFTVLGIAPELGRVFTPAEDRVGAPDVIVLSDTLWRTRFGARPDILGQTLELDAKPRTIIGVMPPGFPGLDAGKQAPQYWVPSGPQATADSGLLNRGSHQGFNGLGRLKDGVTLEQARADMSRIQRALAQQYPKSNSDEGITMMSYLDRVVRNSNPTGLWMLLCAVGLLLLVACANLANLLLARAAGRQKANAIRTALGASRARLVGEHLAESLCLGLAGTALGVALAAAAMQAAAAYLPDSMGRAKFVSLDARVLAFAVALALVTSLLFGIAPALRASRARVALVLKQGGRDSSSASGGRRLREILVAVEMGLALVLLVGAGLLVRSLSQLEAVDPGFNPHGVLTFEVSLPGARYAAPDKGVQFYREASRQMSQLAGVRAVATAYPLPFNGNDWENSYTVVGRPAPPPGQTPSANFEMISGDFFGALGAHLLRGRAFTDSDTSASTPVVIVDQLLADRNWPASPSSPDPVASALGRQIHINGKDRTIVGVVSRVMEYDLDGAQEMDRLPETFVPLSQGGDQTDAYFVLRAAGTEPMALRAPAAGVVQGLDPDLPLADVATMDQRLAAWLLQRRLILWLMVAFALLALVLAAIGTYGVLSYAVAERERELGLRMALGADRGGILALVLRQGLRLALLGALGGVVAALALGRFAASLVYGISATDPLTLATVPLVLLAVAALACLVPALRATRVDPMVALRGE